MIGPLLSASDIEAFQETVVPRYLSYFTELAINQMIPANPASVGNIGCRWGYPDVEVSARLQAGSIHGIDPSPDMIALAKASPAEAASMMRSYEVEPGFPSSVPDEQFTHVFSIHPVCTPLERAKLLAEMRRVLVPGGQALLALPLRGSFAEISDMVREYALRQDLLRLGEAVDFAAASRPTIETISEEFEAAGLFEVDVDVQLLAVSFASGRDYVDDAIARLIVEPDTRASLEADESVLDGAIRYLREAICRYWSDGVFELTVNVGCASARRPRG